MEESPRVSPQDDLLARPPSPARVLPDFILALKEALLGMPALAHPEAEELRAQVSRLEALGQRLEAKETELEARRRLVDENWERLAADMLPRLRQRLTSRGLEGVFDFHALLIELQSLLAARTEESLGPTRQRERSLAAQETVRLQGEVLRLQEGRRRLHRHYLRERLDGLQTEVEKLKGLLSDASDKHARLLAELEKAWLDSETKAKRIQQIEAELARASEQRSVLESQFQQAQVALQPQIEEIERLKTALARQTEAGAILEAELARLREDAQSQGASSARLNEELGGLKNERGRLAEELEASRRLAEARLEETRRLESELARLEQEREDLRGELRSAGEAGQSRQEDLEKTLAELEKAWLDSETKAKRIQQIEAELARASDQRSVLESQFQQAQVALQPQIEEIERLKTALARQTEAGAILEAELARLREDAQSQGASSAHLNEELGGLKNERGRLAEELEASRRLAEARLEETRRLEGESARLESKRLEEVHRLEGELARLEQEREDLRSELRSAGEAGQSRQEALEKTQAALTRSVEAKARAEVGEARSQLRAEEESLRAAERERAGLEAEVKRLQAALAALEEKGASAFVPAPEASAPLLEFPPEPEAIRALEAVLPRFSTLVAQIRKLAAGPSQPVAPSTWAVLLQRLSPLQDQLKAASEFIALAPPVAEQALPPLIESALRPWEVPFQKKGLTLLLRLAPQAPKALLQAERLRVAVFQLAANAYENLARGGTLTVSLATEPSGEEVSPPNAAHARPAEADSGEVALVFADTGKGFPASVLAEPFQPFRSARPNHLGLGLALVHRIMQGFGGRLELSNEKGGARAVCRFATVSPDRPNEP